MSASWPSCARSRKPHSPCCCGHCPDAPERCPWRRHTWPPRTGWHADRPANRLDEAIIPVLTLGATRRFLIRPVAGGASRALVVHGGDLVVMGGRCQRDYQHMVPKQKQPAGPQLSLNFSGPNPVP
ncbi:alpha-ketoglutarate-dependent dioxygenase AlkB [Streptomyces sp. MI02-2A]|uniref:alpha-ketoglutarate-dependent dioxygenase AlkB n=1 Tax=unclassified Streptomyces TaxID=2593676 RepID=UPI000E23B832